MSTGTKDRILSMLDSMLLSHTDGNATLTLLYDEIEQLYEEMQVLEGDVLYLNGKVARLQGGVYRLEAIQEIAENIVAAMEAQERGKARAGLAQLKTQLKVPAPHVAMDPANTQTPFTTEQSTLAVAKRKPREKA